MHELGHSFGGLADEYADAALTGTFALPSDEKADLGEANVTLRGCFDLADLGSTVKWRHFLALPGAQHYDGIHEGGYFRAEGVFRPFAFASP